MDLSTEININPALAHDRSALVRTHNKGEFWKPCPGTTGDYICCGYQIITPMTGCGMYCSYCILQSYFPHQCQVLYTNLDDMQNEIINKMKDHKEIVRFGTGEFGDSLFRDDELNLSKKITEFLEPYDNVVVEFKTKSVTIANLKNIKRKRNVIVGFSMNTPRMIDVLEHGTASLVERLEAAAACETMGFHVAFHFDPMIYYPGWEEEYRAVVSQIYQTIKNPERIAWISMGGFRTMPSLKQIIKGTPAYNVLFSGEQFLGEDKKVRYFRPLRIGMYCAMQNEVEKHHREAILYLCMESPEAWKESCMAKRIPNGLAVYLDEKAQKILK